MIRSGFGVHLSSDGTIYMGNWENDQMNGSGRIQFSSGAIYQGELVNNCFQGRGQYTWPNGSHFDGTFVDNRCGFLFVVFCVCNICTEIINFAYNVYRSHTDVIYLYV